MAQSLGRGLGSLIPKKTLTYGQNPFDSEDKGEKKVLTVNDYDLILKVSPSKISVNPKQPRIHFDEESLNDLAESIKEHGIISPLIVTKKGNEFELIAGERRWRASKILKLKEVPVIVRNEKDQKKLEIALIENLQRENLSPVETARAYKRLIDEFNITQEETAKRVGKARSSVANALRLLNLPEEIQRALSFGKITEAHAKYLLGLDSENKQLTVFKKIIRQNMTVADTSREIKRLSSSGDTKRKNYADKAKEEALSQKLATKVEIKRKRQGGRVIIDFYSDEELNQIIKKIKA